MIPQQRFDFLDQVFEIDGEGKVSHPLDNSKKIGTLMRGKGTLLFHRFLDDTVENFTALPLNIVKNVDEIFLESSKRYYRIPCTRFLEFAEVLDNDFVVCPLEFWGVRPKEKQVLGGIVKLDEVEERRRNLLGDNWYEKLKDVLASDFMLKLGSFIRESRQHAVVYPAETDVFKAYQLCSPQHCKVIILGQNPYYQPGVADGLAFSYKTGIKQVRTQALDIILEEIEADVYNGFHVGKEYKLDYLAHQGVMLLNTSLTVLKGDANSHLNIGWERFTKITIWELLNDPKPKVVMAWGKVAQEHIKQVLEKTHKNHPHLILTAPHPAYDIRLRNDGKKDFRYPDAFLGCKHFSKANEFLQFNDRKPITW